MDYMTDDEWRKRAPHEILPFLASIRKTERFSLPDGLSLYAEYYEPEKPRGVVFICHGYGESSLKYRELTYYFLRASLAVYIPEHRGHGRTSGTDSKTIFIRSFSQYATDFYAYCEHAKERLGELPLYLFSHSMGGTIAAMVLESHPSFFTRAILSSPMIAPTTMGIPAFVPRVLCRIALLLRKGEKAIYNNSRVPRTFETSSCNTPGRFDVYMTECGDQAEFQKKPSSYRWFYEALRATKPLIRHARHIRTPLLILEAELDTKVKNSATNALAATAGITPTVVKNCKHELFTAPDEYLPAYLDLVLDFFK